MYSQKHLSITIQKYQNSHSKDFKAFTKRNIWVEVFSWVGICQWQTSDLNLVPTWKSGFPTNPPQLTQSSALLLLLVKWKTSSVNWKEENNYSSLLQYLQLIELISLTRLMHLLTPTSMWQFKRMGPGRYTKQCIDRMGCVRCMLVSVLLSNYWYQ